MSVVNFSPHSDTVLTGSLEENVLTILCHDPANAPALAVRITDGIFSTRAYRSIAKVAINHLLRFNNPVGAHLLDLFEDKIRSGSDDAKLLKQTIAAMDELSKGIQAEYVLSELDKFIASRQLSTVLENAMDLLHKGKIQEAQDAVFSVSAERKQTSGIFLHDVEQSLAFMDKESEDKMSSGIDILDERGFCPERKALFLWMATAGAGKTWGLVNCGRANVMRGRSVLHLSLEMAKEKIIQRYVQNFFALAKEELPMIRTPKFVRDQLGRCVDLSFNEVDVKALGPARRAELEMRMQSLRQKAPLLVQDFPSGSLTVAQLEAYLEFLERTHKFRPDVVILDYWDLMHINSDSLRIDTGRIGVMLRGLAGRRGFALVTATQGNRATATAATVRRQHVAEDWSKMATADFVATYTQTEAEESLNLARIFTEKGRDVAQHYTVLIGQAYPIGQFCIDGVVMDARLKERAKQMSGEE